MKKLLVFLVIALTAFVLFKCHSKKDPKNPAASIAIQKKSMGFFEGQEIFEYTMENPSGMQVSVMTYGAAISNVVTPDKNGEMQSVVLGFDSLSHYTGWQNSLMGSVVGRVANRISNKKFTIDGQEYTLTSDIHGGEKGFDKRVWTCKEIPHTDKQSLAMFYHSEDGEEGFPGNLKVTITYTLTNNNELVIDYHATTDKATPVVLTNHSYFNLSGGKDENVRNTWLTIFADQFLEFGEGSYPTGKVLDVKNTAFDFLAPKKIGESIDELPLTNGYDVTFVLNNDSAKLVLAAHAFEPLSGRVMEVYTTEPGVVFYSGNWLSENVTGRNGVPFTQHGAFCLETQHFPNSPNIPEFPNTILRPGETFTSQTIYKFSNQK